MNSALYQKYPEGDVWTYYIWQPNQFNVSFEAGNHRCFQNSGKTQAVVIHVDALQFLNHKAPWQ